MALPPLDSFSPVLPLSLSLTFRGSEWKSEKCAQKSRDAYPLTPHPSLTQQGVNVAPEARRDVLRHDHLAQKHGQHGHHLQRVGHKAVGWGTTTLWRGWEISRASPRSEMTHSLISTNLAPV